MGENIGVICTNKCSYKPFKLVFKGLMHLNELNYKTSTWWLRNSYQINAIKYKINFV